MGSANSLALYRKYRGVDFSDIIGQRHITDVLENAIKSGRLSHAYLFTGPRGVGKTSVARILAHRLNDLDYKAENNHIDIIEIDAASNRRIDEIRDLREKSHVAPVSARYKVYIIDEVHMLTKEAFNALLKTLEEPPAHVIFILATTELHKLPQTIVSRTQRHTFRPITLEDAVEHLEVIAKKEKIKIDTGAIRLIATHGDGSFRDAISLLDQAASLGVAGIDVSHIHSMLGLASSDHINSILESVEAGNAKLLSKQLLGTGSQGIQADQLALQLIKSIKDSTGYLDKLDLVDELMRVPASSQPGLKLELVLLGELLSGSDLPEASVAASAPEPSLDQHAVKETAPPIEKVVAKNEVPREIVVEKPQPVKVKKSGKLDSDTWAKVIELVKKQNNALASILRSSKPNVEGSNITLALKFDFHRKKLADKQAIEMIAKAVESASGKSYSIATEIDSDAGKTQEVTAAPTRQDDTTEQIINTFGGGERVSI